MGHGHGCHGYPSWAQELASLEWGPALRLMEEVAYRALKLELALWVLVAYLMLGDSCCRRLHDEQDVHRGHGSCWVESGWATATVKNQLLLFQS